MKRRDETFRKHAAHIPVVMRFIAPGRLGASLHGINDWLRAFFFLSLDSPFGPSIVPVWKKILFPWARKLFELWYYTWGKLFSFQVMKMKMILKERVSKARDIPSLRTLIINMELQNLARLFEIYFRFKEIFFSVYLRVFLLNNDF